MAGERAEISIVTPGASDEQAAAIATAIQRFRSDHALVMAAPPAPPPPWLTVALREGVDRGPGLPPGWT